MLLARLLRRLIRVGTLTVIDARATPHVFAGPHDGPAVTIRLHDPALHWKLFLMPDLACGEAIMDGRLTVEDGSLYDFIDLIGRNIGRTEGFGGGSPSLLAVIDRWMRRLRQINPAEKSRRNVAHHYDLSPTLYDLFLDADRQYSCAYFKTGSEDLDTAQRLKKDHIAAKLLLNPGQRVLDIGSGWGGMALHLAHWGGCSVDGITLSKEQLAHAENRAREHGLQDRVSFHLRDYRRHRGTYDRIVSVGMFEHVGVNHYRNFFDQLNQLLADDGVALLHTIGRTDGPGTTSPWIRKYIFPGGYSPALSEIIAPLEAAGLVVTDVEVLRLHYAETLRHWRRRFLANRDKAVALYDERFARMWEYYLAASESAFRHMGLVVFQIQIAKRQEAVPLTRDYLTDTEAAPSRAAQ